MILLVLDKYHRIPLVFGWGKPLKFLLFTLFFYYYGVKVDDDFLEYTIDLFISFDRTSNLHSIFHCSLRYVQDAVFASEISKMSLFCSSRLATEPQAASG